MNPWFNRVISHSTIDCDLTFVPSLCTIKTHINTRLKRVAMTKKENQSDSSTMFIAVIQAQDIDAAAASLKAVDVSFTRLPSVGGFLGRRNSTLLLGLKPDEVEKAETALKESCRQRIEYLAVPLESAPLPLPTPTPINVGGANIFNVTIEHFEEF